MRRVRTGRRDVVRKPEPQQPGRVIDARLHLLDRQVLDVDGMPVCTLDDLELGAVPGTAGDPEPGAAGASGPGAAGPSGSGAAQEQPVDGTVPVTIAALLTGPVLGTRVFGGRPPASRWHRLPWSYVADTGTVVRLGVRGEGLEATWLEGWVRNHIVGRIPGGQHDPESSG